MPDQPKTPHATFRLGEESRRQLKEIADVLHATQTDAVRQSIAAFNEAMKDSPAIKYLKSSAFKEQFSELGLAVNQPELRQQMRDALRSLKSPTREVPTSEPDANT